MCGASEQCRLAPLVRAGLMMHLGTWISYEYEIKKRASGPIVNVNEVSEITRTVRNRFNIAGRQLPNDRCCDYGLELRRNSGWLPKSANMATRAANLADFVQSARRENLTPTNGGAQFSLASKVFWFFSSGAWIMFDRNARKALEINGIGHAAFASFYGKLHVLEIDNLINEMQRVVGCMASEFPNAERIIDKMLWIMGDKFPCKHLISDPAALNPILGQPLADQINSLTEALNPIICASRLGQFLLTKSCFRIPEAP